MFGSLFGKKNPVGPESHPLVSTAEECIPKELAPQEYLSELDGLSIEDYAQRQGMTTDEVWNRLRRGQLVGRTSRGKVLVYESISAAALAVPGLGSPGGATGSAQGTSFRSSSDGDLPPLEFGASGHLTERSSTHSSSMVSMDLAGPQSTELALLLDHLSLAKEENREIIRLTQDTLTKLSSMTDAVVQMKDEVIKSKDIQLAEFQHALAEKERNISQLRQEKEDLEILNRTLGHALGNTL